MGRKEGVFQQPARAFSGKVGTGFPQKTRQNNTLEPFHDSVKSESALEPFHDSATSKPALNQKSSMMDLF
jgi:hypothetical protein